MNDRCGYTDIQGHVAIGRDICRTALISIDQADYLTILSTDGDIVTSHYIDRRRSLKIKHFYRLGIL